MAAFQQSQWMKGFLWPAGLIRTACPPDRAGINNPAIAEPVAWDRPAAPGPVIVAAPTATTGLRHDAVPRGHPVGLRDGVRVMPLAAFAQGGRAGSPTPRTRPDHVLIWITEGRAGVEFPDRRQALAGGDLLSVPSGTAFAVTPDRAARGHVVLIAARLAAEVVPRLPDRPAAARVGAHAAQLAATLHELSVEAPQADGKARSCLTTLLSLRVAQMVEDGAAGPPSPALADRPLVERFLDLARQTLGQAGTVADLAARLGSTAVLLDQACLAAQGKRAIDVIHDLRLDGAVRLLRDTSLPAQRIAADLGYASHAHFVRAFAAATGRRPDAFRAQSR